MQKIKHILLLCLTLPHLLLGQRGYDEYDEYDESFNWNKFNFEQFLYSAFICAGVILLGLFLLKKSKSKIIQGLGSLTIGIGCIASLIKLSRPILAAIQIIWQVAIGVAIFGAIVLGAYAVFIENDDSEK